MEKMDGKSMDIVAENVAKLRELFPEAFTEGKVDFAALKEILGTFEETQDERYSFTWNGKSKARMIAQTPSTGTLRPCKDESVDWDTTQNIFIEGDNLEVLKLLQKSYHKKVKMIYIDPPYNTGNDFVYKDNFKDNIKNYKEITGQVDGEGRNISNNPETSGRYHTNWLNMMYPRLKLARNLLKDDGVIFISIDDNEVSNLRKMCDEIFGEENFVAELIWKSRQNKDNRNVTGASIDHEYILCFSKSNTLRALRGAARNISQYTNPDDDPRGDWASGNMVGLLPQDQRPNCHYDLINPETEINYGKPDMGWRYDQSTMNRLIDEDRLIWPSEPSGRPRRKVFLNELTDHYTGYSSIVGVNVYTRNGTAETETLFNKRFFDFPKPTELLIDIVKQASDEDGIILDFFAGSATTAHAVMQLNSKDQGTRKCITVQFPEATDEKSEAFKSGFKTIAEIGKERIRRSAAKIKAENQPQINTDKHGSEGDLFDSTEKNLCPSVSICGSKNLDLGFKVFKLDSTNIKPWEVDFDLTERTLEDFISNIKTDRREEDVLYEVLLKYGLDLTLPITEHNIAGQKVFDIGMGALIICLSDAISLEVVEGIAKLKDELNPEIMRVVFKDSGFKDDVVKTNAVQILRTAGIVDVRSL